MKPSQIKPVNDFVFVEPDKQAEQTASGLLLPASKDEVPQTGVILTSDHKEDVGQHIIYKKWGGNEYQIEDTKYLFVKRDDILGVIEE